MSEAILHITSREAWDAACQNGSYLAPSLETEGFIHCSTAEQAVPVANAFYAGQRGLVLLVIDPARLTAVLKWEPPAHVLPDAKPDVEADEFPHIYGPINVDAVTDVLAFEPDPNGQFILPPALQR